MELGYLGAKLPLHDDWSNFDMNDLVTPHPGHPMHGGTIGRYPPSRPKAPPASIAASPPPAKAGTMDMGSAAAAATPGDFQAWENYKPDSKVWEEWSNSPWKPWESIVPGEAGAPRASPVPKGSFWETRSQHVVEALWQWLEMGTHMTSQTTWGWAMIIGTQTAKDGSGNVVTWACTWDASKNFFRRIQPVEKVLENLQHGGTVHVSPQEFGFVPADLNFPPPFLEFLNTRGIPPAPKAPPPSLVSVHAREEMNEMAENHAREVEDLREELQKAEQAVGDMGHAVSTARSMKLTDPDDMERVRTELQQHESWTATMAASQTRLLMQLRDQYQGAAAAAPGTEDLVRQLWQLQSKVQALEDDKSDLERRNVLLQNHLGMMMESKDEVYHRFVDVSTKLDKYEATVAEFPAGSGERNLLQMMARAHQLLCRLEADHSSHACLIPRLVTKLCTLEEAYAVARRRSGSS